MSLKRIKKYNRKEELRLALEEQKDQIELLKELSNKDLQSNAAIKKES